MEQTKKELPYKSLVIDRNMRTVKPSAQKDKELIATIRAEGVIQNLVVAKIPGTEKYAVGAGGRRYSSVGHLIDQADTIKGEPANEEMLLPVLEVPFDQLEKYSLIENHGREDAHPADRFMAYNQLHKGGHSIEQIAATFGAKKTDVKKLLKLASVAPRLIDIYKAGKLSLDAVMAFTISNDHEKQLACYEAVKGRPYDYNIRRFLTDTYMESTDRLVKFVTLPAYRKAGGATVSDMFENITYITNPELVMELADKKLEAAAQKAAKGWKWSAAAHCNQSAQALGRVVEAGYVGLPKELEDRLKAADAELDTFTYKDEEWTDEDEAREAELTELLEKLEQERETYCRYTDEQKALCGVVVYVDRGGKLATLEGVIKKEDEQALEVDGDIGELPRRSSDQYMESNKLRGELDCYAHQAFMAEMLNHEAIAFDVLVYSMAQGLGMHYNGVSNIRYGADCLSSIAEQDTQAAVLLSQAKDALPLGWLEVSEEAERFQAFQALTTSDKRRIMTFCVARSMKSPVRARNCELTAIQETVAFDLTQYWQPTKENYFSRLKKKDLLKIGGEVEGDQWAEDHAKWKAGALCDLLPDLDSMRGWMPPYFKQ